jgi:hypothetical protein
MARPLPLAQSGPPGQARYASPRAHRCARLAACAGAHRRPFTDLYEQRRERGVATSPLYRSGCLNAEPMARRMPSDLGGAGPASRFGQIPQPSGHSSASPHDRGYALALTIRPKKWPLPRHHGARPATLNPSLIVAFGAVASRRRACLARDACPLRPHLQGAPHCCPISDGTAGCAVRWFGYRLRGGVIGMVAALVVLAVMDLMVLRTPAVRSGILCDEKDRYGHRHAGA